MSGICVFDFPSLTLKQFYQLTDNILEMDDFLVEHNSSWTESQLESLKKENDGYVHYIEGQYSEDPHWNEDVEQTLFLSGRIMYYLICGDIAYIIECSSGDLIRVAPKCVHWVNTAGRLTMIKFITSNFERTDDATGISPEIARLSKEFYAKF